MRFTRLITTLVPLMLACAATQASAQAYPSKPIKVILPFGPGAASDAVTRYVTERASKLIGATFVIENKAGANGIIAAREVIRSPADGYTIMVSSNSAHAANVYLYKDANYDPVKDFAPITGLTRNPHVFVVRSSLPVNTLKDLIDYGRANTGKLNYGSGNTGSLANTSLFTSQAGFNMLMVSYKSQPPAVIDLVAGRLDFMSIDYFIVADHIRAGALRPLAVTSRTRIRALPEVQPVADVIPGYELNGWIAAFAPAGTPPEVVGRLNKAFTEVITSPDAEAYFEKLGMIPDPTTPAALGAFVQEQVAKWGDVLRKAGVERQ